MDKANVLGVNIDLIRLVDVLEMIRQVVSSRQRALITHVNVTGLHLAHENERFRQFLNSSDLVYCDGMGVMVGARLLGYNIPERFTLADWIEPLAGLAERNGFSLFFLGNPPGVAENAAPKLQECFPDLIVKGAHHGFFNKSPSHPENEAVLEQINESGADILLVGFGMPAQEIWLQENWESLNVYVAITVGALFEYITGDLKRGPRWMTQNYLEWLYRMVTSPGRYGKRYLRDNPLFLYRILMQKLFGLPAPISKVTK